MPLDYKKLMHGNIIGVKETDVEKGVPLTEIKAVFFDLYCIEKGHLEAFPVPLSERVLSERFGFKKSGEAYTGEEMDRRTVIITRMYLPSGSWVLHYNGTQHGINFIHELQNIWLFLFGEPIRIADATCK